MNIPNERSTTSKYLVTIHSQKGGVGKTLIALYLARRFVEGLQPLPPGKDWAPDGLRTVLIDGDLAGTSLADVLPLSTRTLNGSKLTADEVDSYLGTSYQGWDRNARLAFLNRYLFCDPWHYGRFQEENPGALDGFGMQHLLWWPEDRFRDWLAVIPASAFPVDIAEGIPHIFKEDITHFLHKRLTDLVLALWVGKGVKSFDVVVIDTPPTLYGVSRVVLDLHWTLPKALAHTDRSYTAVTGIVLVNGPDTQDLVASIRALAGYVTDKKLKPSDLGRIFPVLNRYPQPDEPIEFNGRKFRLQDSAQAKQYFYERLKTGYVPVAENTDGVDILTFYKRMRLVPDRDDLAQTFSFPTIRYGKVPELDRLIEELRTL